jgi:hypothetical protein
MDDSTPKTERPPAKILIELSPEHHHSLLKRASENSPVYFRLQNAVKTEANSILVPCDHAEAEMLLQVAKHFCQEAVAAIEAAIKEPKPV